jgi:hypothetical protein
MSHLVVPKGFKQDISQLVQGFPELQRVDQGLAVDISPVVPVQVFPLEHEACDLPTAEPDICQIPAHAHEERTPEDIRGF